MWVLGLVVGFGYWVWVSGMGILGMAVLGLGVLGPGRYVNWRLWVWWECVVVCRLAVGE